MATFNAPVVTVLEDHDYTVTLKVTGQYTSACTNSNTTILVANSVGFANASMLCLLDVAEIQYAIGSANGIVSIEYYNPAGNVTVFTASGPMSGHQAQLFKNPTEANSSATVANNKGDINLLLLNMGANESFTLVLTIRKSDFNGAFANIGLAYDSPWGQANIASWWPPP